MNKKGFTLVEMLTVIILLSLIAILTTPVVIGVLGESKDNLNKGQIQIVEKAAERWGISNLKKLPSSGNSCYIEIADLEGYLSNSSGIKNPKTGQDMAGKIVITNTSTSTTSDKYTYKYYSEDSSEYSIYNNKCE